MWRGGQFLEFDGLFKSVCLKNKGSSLKRTNMKLPKLPPNPPASRAATTASEVLKKMSHSVSHSAYPKTYIHANRSNQLGYCAALGISQNGSKQSSLPMISLLAVLDCRVRLDAGVAEVRGKPLWKVVFRGHHVLERPGRLFSAKRVVHLGLDAQQELSLFGRVCRAKENPLVLAQRANREAVARPDRQVATQPELEHLSGPP